MSEIVIRIATEADTRALATVCISAFPDDLKSRLGIAACSRFFGAFLGSGDDDVILAERNGEVLGFAILLPDMSRRVDRGWLWRSWPSLVRLAATSTSVWARTVAAVARRLRRRPPDVRAASPPPPLVDHASLYLIGVAPHARGLGLGRSLLHSCIDRAVAAGRRGIVLNVRTDNAAAIRLYEDTGFVPVGDSPEHHTRMYRRDLVLGDADGVTPSAPDGRGVREPRTAPRTS